MKSLIVFAAMGLAANVFAADLVHAFGEEAYIRESVIRYNLALGKTPAQACDAAADIFKVGCTVIENRDGSLDVLMSRGAGTEQNFIQTVRIKNP